MAPSNSRNCPFTTESTSLCAALKPLEAPAALIIALADVGVGAGFTIAISFST
ncbi:hypothetical protein D9M68_635040 [compost metagenome]